MTKREIKMKLWANEHYWELVAEGYDVYEKRDVEKCVFKNSISCDEAWSKDGVLIRLLDVHFDYEAIKKDYEKSKEAFEQLIFTVTDAISGKLIAEKVSFGELLDKLNAYPEMPA